MMSHLDVFYLLKQKILEKYKEQYPYYEGEVYQFGNKEIAQLLDLVEKDTNERVSEKWVYTHLKPKENSKLPRKDMLDIFSRWTGYTDWDEFVYLNKTNAINLPEQKKESAKKNNSTIIMGAGILLIAIAAVIGFTTSGKSEVTVCFKDRYTQKSIDTDKFSLFLIENGGRKKLKLKGNCAMIKSDEKELTILIESPYYKKDTLTINMEGEEAELNFDLQPDDYAMMLRAYMNSDIDDWNKRKKQLEDILSDNAVIQEVMFEEIGVEFLNKEEFIAKVTTPTETVKQMEIIEIEYEADKIISLKYIQK